MDIRHIRKHGIRLGACYYDNVYKCEGRAYKVRFNNITEFNRLGSLVQNPAEHLVKVFNTYEADDGPVAVMECLEPLNELETKCLFKLGRTCGSKVARELMLMAPGQWVERAHEDSLYLRMGLHITQGLRDFYLHFGEVYSDLHPANLMRTANGCYKLIDLE